ncbi:MAG: chromate transporter [Bacteroidales bacterium]|nr:chromate transporter [Bacteroidales bacterium]
MIFWELFITFFVIGMFTIGGGYAMLSLIQTQVVTEHGWLTEGAFTDIVAISQMTPGPIGINCATYVGYDVLSAMGASQPVCIIGSMTATLAVVLPSFIIVLLLCKLYTKFSSNPIFTGIMNGLKPAVVGLIGAAAVILITPENFPDWKSWILFAVAFMASYSGKVSPILMILAGGAAGLLIY